MYEHLFRCVPMTFVNSPKSRGMTHFQFRFAMLCLMNSTARWQLPFEENALIRMADPYNVLRARNEQVADCRALFLSAGLGFFIRASFRGEEGLVIAEEFRRDDANAEKPPKGAVAQIALSLPDEFSVVPASSGLRLDHDLKKSDPNQRAATPAQGVPPRAPVRVLMNRSDAAGRESGKFARTIEELLATPVGKRLNAFLGRMQMASEMVQSGAYWLSLIEHEAELIDELLDEGERRAVDFTDAKSRAKFLSKRIKERRAA